MPADLEWLAGFTRIYNDLVKVYGPPGDDRTFEIYVNALEDITNIEKLEAGASAWIKYGDDGYARFPKPSEWRKAIPRRPQIGFDSCVCTLCKKPYNAADPDALACDVSPTASTSTAITVGAGATPSSSWASTRTWTAASTTAWRRSGWR